MEPVLSLLTSSLNHGTGLKSLASNARSLKRPDGALTLTQYRISALLFFKPVWQIDSVVAQSTYGKLPEIAC